MTKKRINEMTEDEQIAVVSSAPHKIRFIKNPTEVVQWAAVRENPWALEHIDKPAFEVQRYVLKTLMTGVILDGVAFPGKLHLGLPIDIQVITEWRINYFKEYAKRVVRKGKTLK